MGNKKYWQVIIDRPLGSRHPYYKNIRYPVNYGYIPGLPAPDGEEQDAYLLGVEYPVAVCHGRLLAVIRRRNDVEDKWVVAPEGFSFSKDEIQRQTAFIEQYFDSEIIMMNPPCP